MKEIIIDAKNKPLGRIASQIAVYLQGKNDPSYDPRLPGDVRVVVKNVKEVKLTGNKFNTKIYYRHSGRLGHLKEVKIEKVFARDPAFVLKHAVRLMLPKNRLNKVRLKNLIIE